MIHAARDVEIRTDETHDWTSLPDVREVQWTYKATMVYPSSGDDDPIYGQLSIAGAIITQNPDLAYMLFPVRLNRPIRNQLRFAYKHGTEWRRRTFLKIAFCTPPGTQAVISQAPDKAHDVASYLIPWACAIPAGLPHVLHLEEYSLLELMEEQRGGELKLVRTLSQEEVL